ncbi:hypothetical protein FQN50_003868 [Emmonsiellopsis sp. PD_5]|nr:hypothetical protein FQN50_003868 [Emmonsiellopsis sp. PD_5]
MSPSSPITPSRRRRNPSNLGISTTADSFATNGYGHSPLQSPQTPRYSGPLSPMSPRHEHSEGMDRSTRFSGEFTAQGDSGGGGLGNLADELADAWDEEGEAYTEGNELMQVHEEEEDASASTHNAGSGSDEECSQSPSSSRNSLQLPKQRSKGTQRHRRIETMYDGSDYGNDSDFEEAGDLTPGLEARMAGLENLVRWGMGDNGPSGQIVDRVIESLRDLGGQSGIENSATRLITAHASLTSHLTHQTRTLQTLTHPLLFSPFPILSLDAIDDLIPLIDDMIPNLPFPVPQASLSQQTQQHQQSPQRTNTDPLLSLRALLSQTSDLTHALRALNDTIHESRQLTSAASRRLKSVRELVAEMRREEEGREEGTRWIEKGEWDRRLQEREAGRVCGDVVSGFEAVCGEWRARLFGAEVAAA